MMIAEYNAWRKDNPHRSIRDFCRVYGHPFNLDTITDIFCLSRVIEIDTLTPAIEESIKNEIHRILYEIDDDTILGMTSDLKEELEENLKHIEVDFEYEGYGFTYKYSYNIEARVTDIEFNKFIQYKAERTEGFHDFLPSRQERCKQFIMAKYAYIFLLNLQEAIKKGLNVNTTFLLTYEGFTFRYHNIGELPEIFYDEQVQGFIRKNFPDFKNRIWVDEDNPTINNINEHIWAFYHLQGLIEKYDESVFHDALENTDLESELDDQVMDINEKITNIIIIGFRLANFNNPLTQEQLLAATNAIILDISVGLNKKRLSDIVIDNSFDNKVIPLDFLFECGTYLNQQIIDIIESFKGKINSYPIKAKILLNNQTYGKIQNTIKQSIDYQNINAQLGQAVEAGKLLNIHRIMAAIAHVIDSQYEKEITNEDVAEVNLNDAMADKKHYHKTFVLGNKVTSLKYSSKTKEKLIEQDISCIFSRLQYTGRSLMKEKVKNEYEPINESEREQISEWRNIISTAGNGKKKVNFSKLERNISEKEKLIAQREAKISAPIPLSKAPNFLVPTFIFTVGYKGKDSITLKREFIEVSIGNGNINITPDDVEEKERIDTIRTKTEEAFKSVIQDNEIDNRDLFLRHSYDSERVFASFITKHDSIIALVDALTQKISERNDRWNQDGNTCKVYAVTILAYSTNATCRNCTRVYIALGNDTNEGSFLDLLTKAIKKIPGLSAYDSKETKADATPRAGIRIRSLVVADHDYHEHQVFVKKHPETLVQQGEIFSIKESEKKSFVEMVRQDPENNTELHPGASFNSGLRAH